MSRGFSFFSTSRGWSAGSRSRVAVVWIPRTSRGTSSVSRFERSFCMFFVSGFLHGFGRALNELVDFFDGKFRPLPATQQAWQGQVAEADADQARDGDIDGFKQTTHDAVFALLDGDVIPVVTTFSPLVTHGDKMGRAIFEGDAFF